MAISELMMLLNKQRETREKNRREAEELQKKRNETLRKTVQAPVEQERAKTQEAISNAQGGWDALGAGILGGMSEGMAQARAEAEYREKSQYDKDLDFAEQYLQEMQNNTMKVAKLAQTEQAGDKWFQANQDSLRALVQKLPNMTPEQGVKALEPFMDDYSRAVGGRRELVDFNPTNGNITMRHQDGSLSQGSIYDDFPDFKSQYLYARGMRQSGYSDEEIINQARLEEQQATAREDAKYNEQVQHQKEMEALQREKIGLAQRTQAEQQAVAQKEAEVFADAPHLRALYTEHQKNAYKQVPELNQKLREGKEILGKRHDFFKDCNKLKALQQEFRKLNPSWLSRSNIGLGKTLTEWVANGSPTAEVIAKKMGMNEKEAEFLKDRFDQINNMLGDFYGEYAESYMGRGVRSDRDMEEFRKNIVPHFFSPGNAFNNSIDFYIGTGKKFITRKVNEMKDIKTERDDYYLSPEEFVQKYKNIRQGRE